MSFFDWVRNKTTVAEEVRSAPSTSTMLNPNSSFVSFLQANDNWDLSFMMLLQYYERCAPFGNAVNIISEKGADIIPHVWSKKKKDYIDGHPILSFLDNPNGDMDYHDFMGHLLAIFLITGNPFPEIIGNVSGEPIEIDVVSPTSVNIIANTIGEPGTINVNSIFGSRSYTQQIINGRTVMINAAGDRQIAHIKGFNPKRGSNDFFSSPIARPLYHDIEQYIQGGLHNKSLLEKGARPSGILTTNNDEPMSDEEFERLETQLRLFLQGAGAAGEVMIGENAGFRELSVNNKDMDYKALIQNATESIYNQFRIPLPTVSSGAMKYSNFSSGQIAQYNQAILPRVSFIFRALGNILFPRFGDTDGDLSLVYNTQEVPALAPATAEDTSVLGGIGVMQVNELRGKLGLEALPGGDVILRPANDVPALDRDDMETDNNEGEEDEQE